MVWIPPCKITMGPDESAPYTSPAHEVVLDGYWIDRHPVTVSQFAAFLNETALDEHYVEAMANPNECGILADGSGGYEVVPGREDYPVVYTVALAYGVVRPATSYRGAVGESGAGPRRAHLLVG
jgi:formylglycine-generating enzyme required for sulfatase activity